MVPVEVSGRLLEAVPAVVDKVPPAADRVRREIVLARFLGKLAVDQGLRELRSRLSPTEPSEAAPGGATANVVAAEDTVAPSTHSGEVVSPPSTATPDAEALALADYDHLSSAQVISKLAGLDLNELDAIELYEQSGRHRRTILGKIDQLRSAEVQS